MVNESEVRKKLDDYLRGRLDADAFEDWLVGHSWDMHKDSSPSAQSLVAAIELALAEHSSGHLALFELENALRQIANNNVLVRVSLNVAGAAPKKIPATAASRAFIVEPPEVLEFSLA